MPFGSMPKAVRRFEKNRSKLISRVCVSSSSFTGLVEGSLTKLYSGFWRWLWGHSLDGKPKNLELVPSGDSGDGCHFFHDFSKAFSGLWSWFLRKSGLELQDVSGGLAAVRVRNLGADAADQAQFFQCRLMIVALDVDQAGVRDALTGVSGWQMARRGLAERRWPRPGSTSAR